jgi:outer membrane protein OmpA-like peptidoglycan-associated protein
MQGAMDPAVWLNMANSMADPAAVRNWLWLGDLGVYNKWLQAGVDPAFYTALLTQFSDPGKMLRWAMLPADPKLWNLMLSTLNPNTYIRWGMAAMDPRAWNLMGNVANPALYTGMLGALVNPASYGQANNPWLTWKPPTPVVGASNPWGGEQSASFNLFDPVGILGNLSAMAPGLSLPSLATPAPSLRAAPAPAPAPAASPAPAAKAPEAAPAPAPAPTPAAQPAAEAKPAAKPAVQDNKIVLAGDALFKSGKSSIKSLSTEGKKRLDEVAVKLKAVGAIEQIVIVGHADVTGKAKANQKLSEQRARSVKSYLVAKGVKPALIVTSGVGDSQPVVECDMKLPKAKLVECLAPNRRVEIEIRAKTK